MESFITAAALALFVVASGVGIRAIRVGAQPAGIVIYGTVVAILNAGFRTYTLISRLTDTPFIQPITTISALVLQVGLATFVAISLAYVYQVRREVVRWTPQNS